MRMLEILAWLPAAIWVYLILLRGLFWLPTLRLPPPADLEGWPTVAVVPARNETDIIGETLPSVLAQEYPGRAAVFLVDDSSDDGTGDAAGRLGGRGGLPLHVVGGAERPAGWVTLPFAASVYGAMTVDSARRHYRGAGAAWKGRTYSRV